MQSSCRKEWKGLHASHHKMSGVISSGLAGEHLIPTTASSLPKKTKGSSANLSFERADGVSRTNQVFNHMS